MCTTDKNKDQLNQFDQQQEPVQGLRMAHDANPEESNHQPNDNLNNEDDCETPRQNHEVVAPSYLTGSK